MAKRKVFSPMICEFLFFDENGEKKEKVNYIDLKIQIRELLKDQFEREVLTSVLMDLRKDVSGKVQEELIRMYQDLELHKDAYAKLDSWRWERVSKGIFELTQMEVKDAYTLITRFINDKRATIRKQAEIATVSLRDEGITYFLDHTRSKISEWQQLKLLDVVRNKKDYVPPPFRLWLTSKNNHVVLFSLRLIKYYNQNDASASFIRLLRHKNNQIKKEAIYCIRDFHVTDAVPVLKQIFWKCTTDIKMDILDALSQLATEEDIGFINHIVDHEMAFTVKGKAITALNTIRPEGVLPTNDILPAEQFGQAPTALDKDADIPDKPIDKDKENKPPTPVDSASIPTQTPVESQKSQKMTLKMKPEEISFLPIVTGMANAAPPKEKPLTVKEMDVVFKEVLPTGPSGQLYWEFLPIVVPETVDKQTALNPLGPLVHFDEVSVCDTPANHAVPPENGTDQLQVDYEIVSNAVVQTNAHHTPPETLPKRDVDSLLLGGHNAVVFADQLASAKMLGIKVIHTVVLPQTEPETRMASFTEEIDWCNAFNHGDVATVTVRPSKESDTEGNDGDHYAIPRPLFYEPRVLEALSLLEHIAEMGDQREIPLLRQMLEKETCEVVLNRINTLIAGFTKRDEQQELLDFSVDDVRLSVFEHLLQNKDDEVKLLLLAQIAELGDRQEIPLLKELVLSQSKPIRKSAAYALEQVQQRILEVNQTASKEPYLPKLPTGAVNKAHTDKKDGGASEPASPNKPAVDSCDRPKYPAYGNTLFDHLCSMSTKLYNKER